MADDWCERYMMAASGCAHCTGRTGTSVADVSTLGPWFTAQRFGRCSACDQPVHPGDRIRADGDGGYLCTSDGRTA